MKRGPLGGLTVGRLDETVASEVAAWLLARMGADVIERRPASSTFAIKDATSASAADSAQADVVIASGTTNPSVTAAVLQPSPIPLPTAGVPSGTVDYTTGVALAIAALAAVRSESIVAVSELGVAIQVFLPPVMAVSYGSPTWPTPPDPVAVPSGGWISADLGAPGDAQRFADMIATLPDDADATTVSATAQEWRLAVCEYLPRRRAPLADPIAGRCRSAGIPPSDPVAGLPLSGVSVCDLTSMWAGPLATWLLGRLGATVYKVEPAVRLDGFRALDGRGIHPGGRQRRPGEDSAMFTALNNGKVRMPLDLRRSIQRDQFLDLVGGCDVLIESFSRVMGNFDLDADTLRGTAPDLNVVSMPAFPPGPRRDWVAYGTGAHALSGLGDCGDGSFSAPAVTYADPVAGFTAALAVLAGLTCRGRGLRPDAFEVPLLAAIEPLLAFEATQDLRSRDDQTGPSLFDAGMASGAFNPLPVGDMNLMHPTGPFATVQSEEGVVFG